MSLMPRLKYAAFACDIDLNANPLIVVTDEGSFSFSMTEEQRKRFFPNLPTLATDKEVLEYATA